MTYPDPNTYQPAPEKPKASTASKVVAGAVAAGVFAWILVSCTGGDSEPEATAPPATTAEATQDDPDEAVEEVLSSSDEERQPFTGELTYDETILVLDLVWADTSPTDQDLICTGVDTMGLDWAYDEFSQGAGGEDFDRTGFDDFFTEECS